jgi:ketosteroid isomerase-like protein
MPPGEPNVIGRDSVVARYANFFTKVLSKFELKPGEIQICDNFAFISGDYKRSDKPKAGGTVQAVGGHYLLVLKNQPDGTWKIVRDIWNYSAKL